MVRDNRPKYVWSMVAILNVYVALSGVVRVAQGAFSYGHDSPKNYIFERVWNEGFITKTGIAVAVSLFLTAVPVLISKASNKRVRALGYGIPVLLLLPILYFEYDIFTCTGKLCGMGPSIYQFDCFATALLFALFYFIAKNVHKWRESSYHDIMTAEIVFIAGLILLNFDYTFFY